MGFKLTEGLDLERAAHGEIQVGNAVVALEHGSEDGVEFYGTHERKSGGWTGGLIFEIVRRRGQERAELLSCRSPFRRLPPGEMRRLAQMFHDGVVERLVALLLADLDHAGNLVGLALAHEVGDGGVEHEDFQGGHAAGFVDAAEEVLGDDALERFGQGRADLVLLAGRETRR